MSRDFRFQFVTVSLLLIEAWQPCVAQDTTSPPVAEPKTNPVIRVREGYRTQESEDLALPMKPVVPRSAAAEARNEALSWYMTGRLFDAAHRNEPRKAISSFRKAIKLDPQSIEIYRNLVPLEFEFKNFDAAIKFATKAVQLDPGESEILQLLAQWAAETGNLSEALKYLEQALKSPKIIKSNPEYVALNISLGKLYVVTGQKEQAADCYEVVFDAVKNPEKFGMDSRGKNKILADASTSYEQIGQVLADGNRLTLALEAFELAGKGSRLGAGNLIYNRSRILYLSGKYEEALDELQKYFNSQRNTKRRLPYQLLAEILAKLNRSDELIGRLETMAENDAQNESLQFFLADKLAELNELERARSIYDSMLRNGGDASGYAGLARVLRKLQKADDLLDVLGRGVARGEEALAILEPEIKALSEDKALMAQLLDAGRTRAKAKQLKFEEAYLLARLASALKQPDTSGEFYEIAISLNRNPGRPNVLLQMEMADMFRQQKKYRQAAEIYKEMLASKQLNDRGQARTNYFLAQTLAFDNRTDEALEAIAKSIGMEDDNAEYRYIEGWIYSHARRWDEAIAKFEQLKEDFPDNNNVVLQCQFSISNIYVQKGDQRKGEEILEKVLEVHPDNSQVNNDLGYLWADQGKNLEQAEKMIRKALAAEPDNPSYLDSLGWVLFKLERYEEALPPLEQATQKPMGSDATVWDHLGDALLKLKKIDKAVEAWQTAVERSADDSYIDPQLIERIKEKLKQQGASELPRPAEKGSP